MNDTTHWYPPEIKPIRDGVYQTNTTFGLRYQKWINGTWYGYSDTPDRASIENSPSILSQNPRWRGLNWSMK